MRRPRRRRLRGPGAGRGGRARGRGAGGRRTFVYLPSGRKICCPSFTFFRSMPGLSFFT